jgi:hypothetical protein
MGDFKDGERISFPSQTLKTVHMIIGSERIAGTLVLSEVYINEKAFELKN